MKEFENMVSYSDTHQHCLVVRKRKKSVRSASWTNSPCGKRKKKLDCPFHQQSAITLGACHTVRVPFHTALLRVNSTSALKPVLPTILQLLAEVLTFRNSRVWRRMYKKINGSQDFFTQIWCSPSINLHSCHTIFKPLLLWPEASSELSPQLQASFLVVYNKNKEF